MKGRGRSGIGGESGGECCKLNSAREERRYSAGIGRGCDVVNGKRED